MSLFACILSFHCMVLLFVVLFLYFIFYVVIIVVVSCFLDICLYIFMLFLIYLHGAFFR